MIETSESALREANGVAPCKVNDGGKQTKTGFRDTAIWMSAIEYARINPEETVYFVSSNTRDFGDGTAYPDPMDQDVKTVSYVVRRHPATEPPQKPVGGPRRPLLISRRPCERTRRWYP
ncbi:PIN domain-containing protein [Streptomyces sp. NPDC000851]